MKNIFPKALLFVLLFLSATQTFGLSSINMFTPDSVLVTFRLTDETKQYTKVFLPGSFNLWGPNAAGVIDSSSVSRMSYDSINKIWVKTIKLLSGTAYPYKFYLETNPNSNIGQWITDPNNSLKDNSGNSVINVTNPGINETLFNKDASGRITGITAGIYGTNPPFKIVLHENSDSLDVTGSFNQVTGILNWNAPIGRNFVETGLSIIIYDSANKKMVQTFWSAPPAPNYTVPEWSKSVIWYQLFPERFRNGDRTNDPVLASLEHPGNISPNWSITPWTSDWYAPDSWMTNFSNDIFNRRYGGDLKGIIDKIDYLDSLGVTAIYFNPLFHSTSLHKYNGTSLHHIDPYFGPDPNGDIAKISQEVFDDPSTWKWTKADSLFLVMIKLLHNKGIKLILDMVFEDTGIMCPAFLDVVANQQNSRYKDWYQVTAWDDPSTPQNEFKYTGWFGYGDLPLIAHTSDETDLTPGPKNYFYAVTKRWMDPDKNGNYSDGVDGFRLDSPNSVPDDFWVDWNSYIRTLNPDIYTAAEQWGYYNDYVTNDRFSGSMNYYGFAYPMYNFFIKSGAASDFASSLAANQGTASQNLLGTHDTQRIASLIRNRKISVDFSNPNNWGNASYKITKPSVQDRRIQRLMVFIQMMAPGSPMIYYGDEVGMWGASDPDDRKPMPWPDLKMMQEKTDPRGYARTPDSVTYDTKMLNFYRKLTLFRKNTPAINQGDMQIMAADNNSHCLSFLRANGTDKYIVFINQDSVSHTFSVRNSAFYSSNVNIINSTEDNSSSFYFTKADSILTIQLPGVSGAAIKVTGSTVVSVNQIPKSYMLFNGYPNPFSNFCKITYQIPYRSLVTIIVYDILGRKVETLEDDQQDPGFYTKVINGSKLSSGVYIVRLATPNYNKTLKILHVK